MKPILIAEFGMNHGGSIDTAKEMIRVARECGATLAKGQAFRSADVKGSMPAAFYDKCELNIYQLIELIHYGDSIGIPVFYSIFSKQYYGLREFQKWHKFSAGQSKKNPRTVERADNYNVFASVNPGTWLPGIKKSHVLYATGYLPVDPSLDHIRYLSEYYGRQVGYSDHTIGIGACLKAFREYGAQVIEKHFTLTRDIYFDGVQFRDAVHGALPKELERLAKGLQ